jgi:hypothetical protein
VAAVSVEHLGALLDDLDAAIAELVAPYHRDAAAWSRGPRGKWTAGQHVEHVAIMLGFGAEALERGADRMRRGELGRRPWRDPIQAWWVRTVTGPRFPRGGRAIRATTPSAGPVPRATLAALDQGAARHRTLVQTLAPEERAKLWIWNPIVPWLRWHYTLPEMIRVQTTHARHHARLAAEDSLP